MRAKILYPVCALVLFLFLCADAYAGLVLTGSLRNDAVETIDNDPDFNDILEGKLVLEARDGRDRWMFYSDARVYYYYGRVAEEAGYNEVILMRSFIRYFSTAGDFTVGKTYINLGNPGVFNIFEFDKSLRLNDLSYDREGILAAEYVCYCGSSFEAKVYGGTYHRDRDEYSAASHCAGFSLRGNTGLFDFGLAGNRLDSNRNLAGLFFKGDAGVGLNGSWALHFDDSGRKAFHEAGAGIDYSFVEGRLVTSLQLYYNESGAGKTGVHDISPDYYFSSQYYAYMNMTGKIDEFLSLKADLFANMVDGSLLFIPGSRFVVADGLALEIQVFVPTGKGDAEFSQDTYGYAGTLIRVEGKF